MLEEGKEAKEGKEGKEACLLFPMSLELSVVDAAMILWCQNYGRAQSA